MKIMMVSEEGIAKFPIVSVDSKNWYKLSTLLPDVKLNSMVDILAYYQDNPGLIASKIDQQPKEAAISLDKYQAEIPFNPLSYRDFMLFEQHYIDAKKGFIKKYYPALLPLINIYERVAMKTCPMLKPEKRWYQYPIYYLGNHLNFFKAGTTVNIPPYTKELDYELELGAIICRKLYNASDEEAEKAIGGFVIFNDFSARDVQAAEMKCGFGPMKAKNFANTISSIVVTADEILPKIAELKVSVTINDELVIQSDCRGMQYSLAQAVAYASWEEHLYPGEFVATGTIPGCTGIENGQLLNSGDTIKLEIEGIGSLENRVG